jgi:hypothetical protein
MRLKILNDDEIDALYGRLRFTQEERTEYFTLSSPEKEALGQLHSPGQNLMTVAQILDPGGW